MLDLTPHVAWEEYLRLEDPPGFRLEYDEGRLLVGPTARTAHHLLRDILLVLLDRYEARHPARCLVVAELSFFMPRGRRDFRPDLAVVVDERKEHLDPMGWMEGAPDIAIEILSPETCDRDLGIKARRYFEHGTDEYWLFDPLERTARFLRRGDRG